MEVTLTLDCGDLTAEFTGSDRQELQDELLEFLAFVEANGDAFGDVAIESPAGEVEPSEDSHGYWTPRPDDETGEPDALSPVAMKTGVPAGVLSEVFYVDPDGDHPPELLADDPATAFDAVGVDTAPLVVLYLLEECYEGDAFSRSELEAALETAGIDPAAVSSVPEDYFAREGPEGGAVKLSRSGRVEARDRLLELLDRESPE